MNEEHKALIGLHISVFLVGVTGLLSKLVTTSAVFIVFGRVLFASAALVLILKCRKESILPKTVKDAFVFIALGALLSFHWYAFFHSIKLSSVAIGLLTFATFPFFTTFLEPVFFRTVLKLRDVALAFLCCFGVWLIVPEIDLSEDYGQGVVWGILSGASYAFILLVNKKYVASYSPLNLTLYQCFVALVITSPIVFLMQETVMTMDWIYLFFNGVICTAIAHTLYIYSSRFIAAKTISIVTMLELIYGIVLAYLILGEKVGVYMAAGGCIIMFAAYLSSRKS